ncbi:hypothetical protein DER44DRAFT_665541 [Fusarium oxysporum]|nr:hypothetical protein DER44DRAFT_665541 [Fusarium oxysporum]
MSPLKKLILLILFISFMVFVAFFGRIPALRLIWIHIPNLIARVDQVLTGGRVSSYLSRFSNLMLHERHWTVVIFFMLIMVVGEYMFIPQAWPKIGSFTKLIVVVTVFLPYLFLYLACSADPGYITPENHAYYMSLYPYDHTLFHPGHMCRYGNQHWFILLLISTAFLCTYGGFLGLSIITVRVQRYTPGWSVWKPRGMTVNQYLAGWGWGIQDNVNMGASSLLAALTSPLVWGLLLYTLYLVYCGTTTNETLKWSDWKEDMRDGFAFRRSMPANRQKNERVEPRFTRWPVEVQQVIVTTQDGQSPKDEVRYPGEGEWERVWNLSDVENLYDMGLWDNLVDIFVRNDDYTVMALIQPPQVRRLQMLGTLSLLAIVIGGSVLIFVGTNALSGRKEKDELGRARPPGQARFSVGHEWSIQTWIAIVGVAFALLSYGFTEAYVHLFDTWASRQAQHSNGLDYARYLNSQPRAPVAYGFRGFPSFITLRYFLLIMSIIASVGYKFAIVSPDAWIKENFHPRLIEFIKSELSAVKNGSIVSEPEPWINDFPLYDINRAFIHFNQVAQEPPYAANMSLPPNGLAMVGHANCFSTSRADQFYPGDVGTLHTREVVLVANGSVGKGDFYMTEDPGDWHRMETTSTNWFDPPRRALVEYRLTEFGSLQIQWAKKPNKSSESWRIPVEHRSLYKMELATAEVRRYVRDQNCRFLPQAALSFLSFSNDTFEKSIAAVMPSWGNITATERFNISDLMPQYGVWLDALVKSPDTTLLSGVSAIIRAVMVSIKTTKLLDSENLKADFLPFGEERVGAPAESFRDAKYPFYVGWRENKNTGCHISAAIVFIFLGCFSIMVGIYRIWLGPPALTSWMGQHVFLAGTEKMALSNKVTGLASGYTVAESDLGKLRLSTRKGGEEDAMLKPGVSSDGQQSDSEETKNKGRTGQ